MQMGSQKWEKIINRLAISWDALKENAEKQIFADDEDDPEHEGD